MNLLKLLITAGAVVAAGTAVAVKVVSDRKKQDELDEFLCPDVDEPIQKDIPAKTNKLDDDIEALINDENKSEPNIFTFKTDSKEAADGFKNEVAKAGLTINDNEDDTIVDVVYIDAINETDLKVFGALMNNISDLTNAKYEGLNLEEL